MNLGDIMLSEASQQERTNTVQVHLNEIPRGVKQRQKVGGREAGPGVGSQALLVNGDRLSVLGTRTGLRGCVLAVVTQQCK